MKSNELIKKYKQIGTSDKKAEEFSQLFYASYLTENKEDLFLFVEYINDITGRTKQLFLQNYKFMLDKMPKEQKKEFKYKFLDLWDNGTSEDAKKGLIDFLGETEYKNILISDLEAYKETLPIVEISSNDIFEKRTYNVRNINNSLTFDANAITRQLANINKNNPILNLKLSNGNEIQLDLVAYDKGFNYVDMFIVKTIIDTQIKEDVFSTHTIGQRLHKTDKITPSDYSYINRCIYYGLNSNFILKDNKNNISKNTYFLQLTYNTTKDLKDCNENVKFKINRTYNKIYEDYKKDINTKNKNRSLEYYHIKENDRKYHEAQRLLNMINSRIILATQYNEKELNISAEEIYREYLTKHDLETKKKDNIRQIKRTAIKKAVDFANASTQVQTTQILKGGNKGATTGIKIILM